MENYPLDRIPALPAELDEPYDEEYSSVSVSDESGWTVIASDPDPV